MLRRPSCRRVLCRGLLLPLLLWPLPVAAQSADQKPPPTSEDDVSSFPVGVEAVVVDAVVTDAQGEPVAGLTRDDFRVKEGGKPQEITVFEAIEVEKSFAVAEPSPISSNLAGTGDGSRAFVVVFDDLNLTQRGARRAKSQLEKFIKTIFRPGDLVTLVPTAGGGSWSVRMPVGGDDLQRVLRRFRGRRPVDTSLDRISDYEAMRIHVYRDREVIRLVERRLARSSHVLAGLGEENVLIQTLGVQHRASDVYFQAQDRNRVTLEVLSRILRSLASRRGRKSVILVSEGFIHDTQLDEFTEVARASWAANAAMYFLDVRGLEGFGSAVGSDRPGPGTIDASAIEVGAQLRDLTNSRRFASYEGDGSNSLALDTGGFTVKSNDLAGGLWRIVRESRIYYLLGYAPTNTKRDGKFRKIKVEVKRRGLDVRARKGYYAPSDEEPPAPDPEKADPVVRAALDSLFEDDAIPLRMTAYALGQVGEDRIRMLLAAEADPDAVAFDETNGRFTNSLELFIQVSSRETGLAYALERLIGLDLSPQVRNRMARTWIPVSGSFDLPPGTYQAKLLIRDQQTGRIGTVRHQFDVPAVGSFRTSTPILTDTFRPNQADPSPVPLARRNFFPGVELVCVFDVYGALRDGQTEQPRVALSYGIRRTFVSGDPTRWPPPATLRTQRLAVGPEGQLTQRLKVPLRGAPPGEYEIVLNLRDELSGETVERREAFVVNAPVDAPVKLPAGSPPASAQPLQ